MKLCLPLALAALVLTALACGSRTGLLAPDAPESDAGVSDALPPVRIPPAGPDPCPDAGATLVYVVTTQNVLMSFYPPSASFTTIGTLSCPVDPADQPFSMAVDHTGIAYVAFASGNVFRVSTLDASCQPTARVPPVDVFNSSFGMGFAANVGAGDGGDPETLYLAGTAGGLGTMAPIELGTMDTTTFVSSSIGVVTPNIYGSELTGTGGGQLFGFYKTTAGGTGAAIGEIDRSTGRLLAMNDLPGVSILGGWAFGFWGGDFYTFTAPDGTDTVVQRFRPSDGSIVEVATVPGLTVVGAGVSTCAPQR